MLKVLPTMTEDVVPCCGVLAPQRGTYSEQQARGEVEERLGGCQHSLHCPDELLRLQGRRRGEEADALSVNDVTAGCRAEGRREGEQTK